MSLPTLPSYWPILLALVGFGALGLRRGWVRELATLGVVLLGWLVIFALGFTLIGWANRLALIAEFTWQGGFDHSDPMPLLRALRGSPPIDPWHPEWFYLGLFLLAAVAAYFVGNRLASRVKSPTEAVLGAGAGALNGYVLAYVSLGYFEGATKARGGDLLPMLGGYGTTVVLVVVVAAVAFALMSTSRAAQPKRSGRASG
jgi:hypothetical protein